MQDTVATTDAHTCYHEWTQDTAATWFHNLIQDIVAKTYCCACSCDLMQDTVAKTD